MAEKLRSCPFCGGEAHLTSDYSSELDHTFWQVWHDCSTNPGPVRHTYGHALGMEISTPWCASEDAAVDLWNRRAERTCRVECYPPGHEDSLHYEVCSECGTILTASRPGDRYAARASYCPNCGARVVEEVDDDA